MWHSVDLEGMTHTALALQQVLRTGIRRLRCPRSFVEELHLTGRGLVTYIVVCPDFLQWKTLGFPCLRKSNENYLMSNYLIFLHTKEL